MLSDKKVEFYKWKFEYASTSAYSRSFPAVGKNGKSIIVTGFTDFADDERYEIILSPCLT